jgi:hypothetical protein
MRPEPKDSRLQAPVVSRPAGGDGGAALVGAEQNAPLGSVGRLSALRDQRMALLQAAEDEFDPYNLETVERWRAAGRSSEE